jgi:murein DD-endopeptidase MepM/ murein hydrolase activator NlpD
MLYATDIVRTDKVEKRLFPRENTDYPIFGENVLSPVSGVIFRIVDKIEDNVPYSGKYPYNTGNTVIIRNGNLYMLLGHLKTGSIKVNEGDTIKEKEIIAEVGNSGYSERPHLHMQYIRSETENFWKGKGVSIQYKDRNIFKNRVIKFI